MLKRISGELAIDIHKIGRMERDGDWWVVKADGDVYKIKHFEAIRIFELLGESVTHEERFKNNLKPDLHKIPIKIGASKECDCG